VVRRPATPFEHTTAGIAVALRTGLVVVGWLVAAVGPASAGWATPAVIGYSGWVGFFAWVALTRGLVPLLVAGDLALTVVLFLGADLAPVGGVDGGAVWVALVGCVCVISLPLAWRARAAIPAGLLVVAAFAVSPLAVRGGLGALYNTGGMVVPLLGAWAVMAVVRRASDAADADLAAATEARREVIVAQARRADESAQLRLLHDTALTTLTLVGTGAVQRSDNLGARAAADLDAIQRLGAAAHPTEDGLVRLDEQLADVATRAPGGLRVQRVLVPCLVPSAVADAVARSSAEALTNSARHAGVDSALLSLATALDRVRVEISDNGRGFDPDSAAAHRYGVRESIVGRMAAVGGSARVESAPDQGTRWKLEWSAIDP
jgi:hypothetical protein